MKKPLCKYTELPLFVNSLSAKLCFVTCNTVSYTHLTLPTKLEV